MTKKIKLNIEVYKDNATSVPEAMHTALRKLCGSPATSAMWNALHITSWKTNSEFYNAVAALRNKKFNSEKEAIGAVKQAWLAVEYYGEAEKALIHGIAKMFDDQDWENFCGFLLLE